MKVFLAIFFAVAVINLHAETEDHLRERIDSFLTAGDMHAAIAARAAWLAHEIGTRISATVRPSSRKPDDPDPDLQLSAIKSEFERLYANRAFRYTPPTVPAKWSALKDSYLFGHAKGVFDAFRHDMPANYDGRGERYEAFTAGYEAGLKLGKDSRR